MRTILIFVACFLSFGLCNGQANAPYVYGEAGGGLGTFSAAKGGVNWFFARRHCVGLAYHCQWRDGVLVPYDYREGGLFNIGDGRPNDRMLFGAATYGHVIRLSDIVRLNAKAGLAAGYYRQPSNFIPYKSGGFFSLGPNYTYEVRNELMTGLLLNPVIEFPFSRSWGLAMGASYLVTNIQSSLAFELTMIFGSLREPVRELSYE